MNPDKLFDYLDGKLSPADRTQLEEKLMSDPQFRQQFNIAREIHRSGKASRETIVPSEDPAAVARGGRLGRRIATAAIVLVTLNVLVGIAVITVKNRKPTALSAQEAAIRQQLAASLGAAGANALPAPSFVEDEIRISAPRAEWDSVADRVLATAERCGGSAARGLTDETALTVMVDVPSARIREFRQSFLPGASASPGASMANIPTVAPNERTIVQVRISETAQ